MNSEYSIAITDSALADIEEAIGYIANNLHAPKAAAQLLDDLYATLDKIKYFPHSMPKTSIECNGNLYRKFFVGNYIVIYRVSDMEKKIIIVTVRYAPMSFGDKV